MIESNERLRVRIPTWDPFFLCCCVPLLLHLARCHTHIHEAADLQEDEAGHAVGDDEEGEEEVEQRLGTSVVVAIHAKHPHRRRNQHGKTVVLREVDQHTELLDHCRQLQRTTAISHVEHVDEGTEGEGQTEQQRYQRQILVTVFVFIFAIEIKAQNRQSDHNHKVDDAPHSRLAQTHIERQHAHGPRSRPRRVFAIRIIDIDHSLAIVVAVDVLETHIDLAVPHDVGFSESVRSVKRLAVEHEHQVVDGHLEAGRYLTVQRLHAFVRRDLHLDFLPRDRANEDRQEVFVVISALRHRSTRLIGLAGIVIGH